MPVGDVDRGQPLAGLLDHVAKLTDLGLDVPRVGQDGVGLTGHESRGARRPVLAFGAELTQRGGEDIRTQLNAGESVGRHRFGAPNSLSDSLSVRVPRSTGQTGPGLGRSERIGGGSLRAAAGSAITSLPLGQAPRRSARGFRGARCQVAQGRGKSGRGSERPRTRQEPPSRDRRPGTRRSRLLPSRSRAIAASAQTPHAPHRVDRDPPAVTRPRPRPQGSRRGSRSRRGTRDTSRTARRSPPADHHRRRAPAAGRRTRWRSRLRREAAARGHPGSDGRPTPSARRCAQGRHRCSLREPTLRIRTEALTIIRCRVPRFKLRHDYAFCHRADFCALLQAA